MISSCLNKYNNKLLLGLYYLLPNHSKFIDQFVKSILDNIDIYYSIYIVFYIT